MRRVIGLLTVLMLFSPLIGYTAAPPSTISKSVLSVKEIIRKNLPATVHFDIQKDGSEKGSGSGFILAPSGLVATCYHVVENIKEGSIRLSDGQTFPIQQIVAVDVENDLALIQVQATKLPAVTLSRSATRGSGVELGDEIVTIGSPNGLQGSIATGIISSTRNREDTSSWDIQYTAPTSQGSSGGAIFNRHGEVIAITKSMISGSNVQNLNFSTPVEFLIKLKDENPTRKITEASPPLHESLEKAVQQYLTQHPKNTRAQLYIANQLLKRGEAELALQKIGPVTQSSRPEFILVHALVHLQQAKTKEALSYFEMLSSAQFLEKNPKLYLYLADLYLDQHRLPDAKHALEKYNLLSHQKDALYYYSVGELAVKFGLSESTPRAQKEYFQKAIGFYEAAKKTNPSFTTALYRKGLVQVAAQDIQEAYKTFKILKVEDPILASQLELSIQQYTKAQKLFSSDYSKAIAHKHLMNSVSTLLFSLVLLND